MACIAACATQTPSRPAPYTDRGLDRITWSALERFESEREFRAYLAEARSAAVRRGDAWAGDNQVYAELASDASLKTAEGCDPKLIECQAAADGSQRIVVTASRITTPPFTNTQEAGVDEGDIVKQIGDFLVVLQDGRLFSVALRPGPSSEPGLALAARQDVYRSSDEDTWYDEMLVFDRRIVVTGYSYDENATEFSVLTLREDGSFSRDATFFMSSNDYYDVDNYATRLVGDRLVINTPIYLADLFASEAPAWPVVRRWREEGADGRRPDDRGRRMLNAREVYKPVQRTLRPALQTVSVCPLEVAAEGELDCRTTGLVGPEDSVFYVSETDAWLWLSPSWDEGGEIDPGEIDCKTGLRPSFETSAPAVLYRVPLDGRAPEAIEVRGAPFDQFSLDADEREFRALLVQWPFDPCVEDDGRQQLAYLSLPVSRLGATLTEAPDRAYTPLPSPGGAGLENRFTDTHLVYAGRDRYVSYAPDPGEPLQSAAVVVVPIGAPERASMLTAPHDVIRLEQAGPYVFLTGYQDARGLRVSLVDLRGEPRIADTATLPGRYESEGRSHAFNARVAPDGSGLMGVPTVFVGSDGGRWWWRSEQSDVSFLAVTGDARLAAAGELRMTVKKSDFSYVCEVSCVDWYGNSRPIFTDGRVLALSGTELIEGAMADGRIMELRRLDLTGAPPAAVASLP